MIRLDVLFRDTLDQIRRIGPSVGRAFWTVGDAARAAQWFANVTDVMQDGVLTDEGRVKLSDGAKDVLLLAARIKFRTIIFRGHLDAPTAAEYLGCSRRRVEYAFGELEALGCGQRKREGREVVTFELAAWLLSLDCPRGSDPAQEPAQKTARKKFFDPDAPPAAPQRKILRQHINVSSSSVDEPPSPFPAGAPAGGPPSTPNGHGRKETPRARPDLVLDGSPPASTDDGRGSASTADRTATATTAPGEESIAARNARFLEEHRLWRERNGVTAPAPDLTPPRKPPG